MAVFTPTITSGLYHYEPSHVLPIVFSILLAISFTLHTYQNFRYHFWRVTFWMSWGNVIFMIGWILRIFSSYSTSNAGVYIASTMFIYMGPPVYAAAEYNMLGRLMHYLPMHALVHPGRVIWVFIYLGALVEALAAAGAGRIARQGFGTAAFRTGGTLLAISTLLQAAVEVVYVSFVVIMHRRAYKAGMPSRNITCLCWTLYGTSTLVFIRCIFRAVEAFTLYVPDCGKGALCSNTIAKNEWFLYALEAAPMVLYTFWLNLMHPGRFLPSSTKVYLDFDGRTERTGPGWIDNRNTWKTFVDPFNAMKEKTTTRIEQFWEKPEQWTACETSFAMGTASNAGKKSIWRCSNRV